MVTIRIELLWSIVVLAAIHHTNALEENDKCNKNGFIGTCVRPPNCNFVRNRGRPPLCGYAKDVPLVCCPPDTGNGASPSNQGTGGVARPPTQLSASRPNPTSFNNRKSISQQKCEEYAKSVYEKVSLALPDSTEEVITHCAWRAEELIVGGEKASPKVYTHMALIGYERGGTVNWECGGSLISERFVLSAAHCSAPDGVKASVVRLGELELFSNLDDADPKEFKIIEHFVHPEYKEKQTYNDIVLFKLDSDVKFSPYIRPICLQNTYEIDDRKFKPIVTGWGRLSFSGKSSTDLMQLKVPLTPPAECKNIYKRFETTRRSLIPRGIENQTMVCAGGLTGEDSCKGDSGGPLQMPLTKPECMFSQIGIVSFGNKCAIGYPGVYTRVSYYIRWIERIVWGQ